MTGGTPGRRGAMAHGLAVFLLAGIRREVVRVGVAACLKCRGGMHGFIQIEKSISHLSPAGLDLSFAESRGEYNCMWRCPRPGLNPSGLVNNSSLAAGPQFTEVKIV